MRRICEMYKREIGLGIYFKVSVMYYICNVNNLLFGYIIIYLF